MFPAKVAAELKDFEVEQYIDKKRCSQNGSFYAIRSSSCKKMAVEDANLTINDENAPHIGVWVGSGIGGNGNIRRSV
ncbi:hypothetical protein GCM10020331_078800 [Ectobacillus funiculus]